jgi:signal transduction histidine kinase
MHWMRDVRTLTGLGNALGGLGIVLLGLLLGPLAEWEQRVGGGWRTYLTWDRPRQTDIPPFQVVKIDEAWARHWPYRSPIPRRELAALLKAVAKGQPRLIILDVFLDIPTDPSDDRALARAIRQAGKVLLPVGIVERPKQTLLLAPLPLFQEAAAAVGLAVLWPDEDGVVRRMRLAHRVQGPGGTQWQLFLPALAWALLTGQTPQEVAAAVVGGRWPGTGLRLDRQRGTLLPYRPAWYDGLPAVSGGVVASGKMAPDFFRGKIVLIGTYLEDSADWRRTPLARGHERPGVELLAHSLYALLSGQLVQEVRGVSALLLLLLLGAATGAWMAWTEPKAAAWRGAAVLGGYLVSAALLYLLGKVQVPLVLPAVLIGGTFGVQAVRVAGQVRARDAYMRGVIHDLKNPAAAIQLSAATLQRLPADDHRQDEFLQIIHLECDRLRRDLEDVLDADPARVLNLQRSPVDLKALLEEVVATQRLAHARRHTLTVEAPDHLPPISADRDKLVRVATNLVHNAIKYSPKGGNVTVRVEDHGREVWFSVSDQGIGMTPRQQKRLFRLYGRVLDQKKHQVAGTGVGLYASQRLVQAHGGRIWVESQYGVGTTFYVALPKDEG